MNDEQKATEVKVKTKPQVEIAPKLSIPFLYGQRQPSSTIIRNRHPELVSGSMGYRKSEMLKKFQHDSDIAKLSILDYGLWSLTAHGL